MLLMVLAVGVLGVLVRVERGVHGLVRHVEDAILSVDELIHVEGEVVIHAVTLDCGVMLGMHICILRGEFLAVSDEIREVNDWHGFYFDSRLASSERCLEERKGISRGISSLGSTMLEDLLPLLLSLLVQQVLTILLNLSLRQFFGALASHQMISIGLGKADLLKSKLSFLLCLFTKGECLVLFHVRVQSESSELSLHHLGLSDILGPLQTSCCPVKLED